MLSHTVLSRVSKWHSLSTVQYHENTVWFGSRHELEKPEGVLHQEELDLLMVLYGKAIQPGGPETRMKKSLDKAGWTKSIMVGS
jgi:hypothetical protein